MPRPEDKKLEEVKETSIEDELALNEKLDLFLQKAEKVKKRQEKDWYTIDQFLQGNHYTVYLPKLDKLVTITETKSGVKRTINKIRKLRRGMSNVLLRNEANWNIKPRGSGEEAEKEADVGSKYLRWFFKNRQIREKLADLVWYGLARGIGIGEVIETVKVIKEGKEATEDEVGQEEETIVQLDLKADLDAFDCFLDPSGKNNFFIKTFSKSVKDLEDTKDTDGEPVYKNLEGLKSSKLAASAVKERLQRQEGYEESSKKDKDLDDILCYEFWILEDSKVRIVTRGGDDKTIIRNDSTDKTEFPFELYYPEKKPNTVYPKPWLKDLIPLQRAYNRVVSFVENYIFTMLWGRFVKKKGTTTSGMMTKHGQILTYDGGTRAPETQALQPLPSVVMEYLFYLERQLEDFTVHSESLGRGSSKSQSGKAIALLQAADVENLSDPRTNLEGFLVRIAKKVLKRLSEQITSEEFTLEGEVLKVIGAGAEGGEEGMEGVVPIGEFDEIECEIVPGSAFGDYQQKEEALALKKEGVLDNEAVLEAFKWGAIKEVLDRMEVEHRIEEAKEVPGPTMPPTPEGKETKPDLTPRESLLKE